MDEQRFVYVSLILTTPEKLWEALTNAEFTSQYWFQMSIESDWQVGSPVRYHMNGQITDEGTVLLCDPPKLLSYTFHHILNEEMRNEQPSRVVFEIEPLGKNTNIQANGVRLTVTHDDFSPNSKVFPAISNGWPAILSSLKTLLETGKALPIPRKE